MSGIIGGGFVGQATQLLFPDSIIYDLDNRKCVPETTTFDDILNCKIVFICVPTPMLESGQTDLKYVDSVITKLKMNNYGGYIVIRSTVPVGTCEGYGVAMMPEFLTERNWRNDVKTCHLWIVGESYGIEFKKLISNMVIDSYNRRVIDHMFLEFVSPSEAECIKYTRNCFLAVKVGFFNEIYDFCNVKNVDFETVRRNVVVDSRIGESHTMVPGHDGKRGFGGTCLPKDIASLSYQMGDDSLICKIVETRNREIDRPEADWKLDVGRAYSQS